MVRERGGRSSDRDPGRVVTEERHQPAKLSENYQGAGMAALVKWPCVGGLPNEAFPSGSSYLNHVGKNAGSG